MKNPARIQIARGKSRRIVLTALGMLDDNHGRMSEEENKHAECLRRQMAGCRSYLSETRGMKTLHDGFHEAVRTARKRSGVFEIPEAIIYTQNALIKKIGAGSWHKIVSVVTVTELMLGWMDELSRTIEAREHGLYSQTQKKIANKAANWVAEQNIAFILSMGGWSDIHDYEEAKGGNIIMHLYEFIVVVGVIIGTSLIMYEMVKLIS